MLLPILIIIAGIAADQLTKWLAVTRLAEISTYPLIEGVLHFTYVENTGAAFGMLKDHRWIFMVLSTAAILGLLLYMFIAKPKSACARAALAMIISGGIGNMIDRVALGYVVDFIDVRCIDFYVFNVADSLVCVGCGLLMLYLIVSEVKEARAKKTKGGANDQP